jgi:hypothetical protein
MFTFLRSFGFLPDDRRDFQQLSDATIDSLPSAKTWLLMLTAWQSPVIHQSADAAMANSARQHRTLPTAPNRLATTAFTRNVG